MPNPSPAVLTFPLRKGLCLSRIIPAEIAAERVGTEIKMNIPDMERFPEQAAKIAAQSPGGGLFTVLRFDISHFINDEYGYATEDRVIVACYRTFEAGAERSFRRAAVGCPKRLGCCIGGRVGRIDSDGDIGENGRSFH